jgi:hypothetical protein
MTMGDCAVTTDGIASAPAAAPAAIVPDFRNRRRETFLSATSVMSGSSLEMVVFSLSRSVFLLFAAASGRAFDNRSYSLGKSPIEPALAIARCAKHRRRANS